MRFSVLKEPPFSLDQPALDWVEKTFHSLTADEKIRQLFNLLLIEGDQERLQRAKDFRPGSVARLFSGVTSDDRDVIAELNTLTPTPLLVAADLEGSLMSLKGGAEWPNPLALAAIDDVEVTEQVCRMMAQEALAAGINWSLTPVLDINHTFRSPIVATRGFGSNIDTIEKHAIKQMQAFRDESVASAVKHWPGEGYDDRDQHLLTTINPLPMDKWQETFGRLYRSAIDSGALSVMTAHIALPAYIQDREVEPGVEAFRPASASHALTTTLLRGELGFNGLVVSDATEMAGLSAWSKRAEYLPDLVSAGCDVLLFSDDPFGDMELLNAAIDDGRLSRERVDEAIIRQLGMKAVLGLHKPAVPCPAINVERHRIYAESVARKAPTLVKDVNNLLPLEPEKHKRVLLFSGDVIFPFKPDPIPMDLPDMLSKSGFEITYFDPGMEVDLKDFDLVLYLFGEETLLTRGRIFIDWYKMTKSIGQAMRRHWHETPTLMISFGYPYLLYDAPRVPTYINAYSSTKTMQCAVYDLLLGRGNWNKNNPVDPFAGAPDSRY